MTSNIRFGCQFAEQNELGPIAIAQQAEAAGFDVFSVSDHVGPGLSPMPTLAAVAGATSSIRLATFVLNATMRNPVQLAWEATTLDHLSGGRLELGLGAGHTPHEYAQTGIPRLPAARRKAQVAEQVEILRLLLDGERVDHAGVHHQLDGAQIQRSVQTRLPILVGGNGERLLRHAGAHADIVGLQGLGRTLSDGHRHDVNWTVGHLDEQVRCIRDGASDRFGEVELNALVQVVEITDDQDEAVRKLVDRVDGLDEDAVDEIPYALIGTVDEIANKIHRCHERWGISYFVVRALHEFAPVIATVRART